ncbi:hypothetical protein BSLG_003399 [Batrachochytrium salamandrivorans]|nr:hypothetical protein BSLG_003399 [Batrachochytrium salamandrivorans]
MPISATNSYQGQKRPVNGNSGGHGTSLRGIDRTESTVSDKSAISDMAADYTDTEGYFAMEEEDTPNGGRGVELMRHDSVGRGGGGRHVPLRGRRHEQSRRMMDIESNNDCDSSLLASFDPYLPRRSSSVPLPSVARSRDMQYTLHGSQYGAQLFCKRCNSRNDGSGESSECFASPNGSTHSFVQRRASFSDIGPLNRARLLHPDAEMNQYTAHAHRSATRAVHPSLLKLISDLVQHHESVTGALGTLDTMATAMSELDESMQLLEDTLARSIKLADTIPAMVATVRADQDIWESLVMKSETDCQRVGYALGVAADVMAEFEGEMQRFLKGVSDSESRVGHILTDMAG